MSVDKLIVEVPLIKNKIPDESKEYIPSGIEVYFTKDPKTLEQIDYSTI